MNSFQVNQYSILFPTAVEIPDLPASNVRTTRSIRSLQTTPEPSYIPQFAAFPCGRQCAEHTWRVDGVTGRVRFFAIPTFACKAPPLRVDVYVPDFIDSSSASLDRSDHLANTSNDGISCSRAAEILACILSRWGAQFEGFAASYLQLPYGSYIVIEHDIEGDASQAQVSMVPDLTTERAWLSRDALQTMWRLQPDVWPEVLDWTHLQLQLQPHDTISLVTLDIKNEDVLDRTFVYKSVLRDLQHFYHELKTLLTMPLHPNIIARPRFIVTKRARFGGKRGVCGMILDYHSGGTLHKLLLEGLPQSRADAMWDRISIAKQIVSALMHVRDHVGFYSNLKPHNIIITMEGDRYKPILIDFEQRSGWFAWSAPEIQYVNYIEHLATSSKDSSKREHYRGLLREYIPDWEPLDMKARYSNPDDGYAAAWLILSPSERVSAQVFMLGKLLWCIFESTHGMSSFLTPESLLEPACTHVFPTFKTTPEPLRACIRQCTAGAPEWSNQWPPLTKKGQYVYAFNDHEGTHVDLAGIQLSAKRWWAEQIREAERFIIARSRVCNVKQQASNEDINVCTFMKDRPSMEMVMEVLEMVEQSLPSDPSP